MRVMFDDRPATSATGIGRYTRSMADQVQRLAPRVHALRLSSSNPDFASPTEEELELPALLRDVDIFHSPLWRLPAVLPCRAVITVHDAIPATRPDLATEAARRLWSTLEEEAGRAAKIVCPSRHAAAEVGAILRLDASRIHVVPEAPASVFRPTRRADVLVRLDEPYLLAVGAVERRKNPDGLLEALALLPAERRPLLAFAGPDGGFDLLAEARRLGVADRVVRLGLVDDELLAALYTGALAVLVCSRAEGFGLPVVEAFACEAPVIASATTSLAEVAGDGALLVDPEAPREIAAAIERLVDDPPLRDELRRRGRRRLSLFSSATVEAALLRLYRDLEVAA